jgi:hypothetical protein
MAKQMAASAASALPISAQKAVDAVSLRAKRRHIDPQAGHALEILGHAIEYLTDEYVHEGGLFSAHDARIEAVQLLMALNRKIYYDCPEVPTLRERLYDFFHAHCA